MAPRAGAVSSADESVVMYERWRKLRDPKLLAEIKDYNRILSGRVYYRSALIVPQQLLVVADDQIRLGARET